MSFSRHQIDISQLKQSRKNVFLLALHFYGIPPHSRLELNIAKCYESLYGLKLNQQIHRELKAMNLPKTFNLAKLTQELEQELCLFVQSQTSQSLRQFLIDFVEAEAKELNCTAAIKVLEGYKKKAHDLLQDKPELVSESDVVWDLFINAMNRKRFLVEGWKNVDYSKKIMFGFLFFTCVSILISFSDSVYAAKYRENFWEKFMDRLMNFSLAGMGGGGVMMALPTPPEVIADLKAVDAALSKRIDDHMVHLKQAPVEFKEAMITPSRHSDFAELDVEEPKFRSLKRRDLAVSNEKKPEVKALKKEESKLEDKGGNVYYRLYDPHHSDCFFRFNSKEIRAMLSKNSYADMLVGKIKEAGSNGRVNLVGGHFGVTKVNKRQLDKFETGWKLRLPADEAVMLSCRDRVTEEEAKAGIKEVFSPRGIRLHDR